MGVQQLGFSEIINRRIDARSGIEFSPFRKLATGNWRLSVDDESVNLHVDTNNVVLTDEFSFPSQGELSLTQCDLELILANSFKTIDMGRTGASNCPELWGLLVSLFGPLAAVFDGVEQEWGCREWESVAEFQSHEESDAANLAQSGEPVIVRGHNRYVKWKDLSADSFLAEFSDECAALCAALRLARDHDGARDRVYWFRHDYQFLIDHFVFETGNCRRKVESFMTSPNAISSLHRDAYAGEATVLFGSRTFYLFPPHCARYLYPYPFLKGDNNKSHFVPWEPDFSCFPLAKNATCASVTLMPGDMLYVPSGWFHWVRSLECSLCIKTITGLLDEKTPVIGL